MFLDSKLGLKKEIWTLKILTGYSLWTSSSILSPVQTIILGLSFSASGNAGFESQRTVMATVTRAVSLCVLCATVTRSTFRLTLRTQKWGIAEYAVILALHVGYLALLDAC